MTFTELDKKIISSLQDELPICSHPYQKLADKIGIDEELLLLKIKSYLDNGIIRRFGATLKHRNIGYTSNAMVVWQVDPQLTKKVGKTMAAFKEVSHCYERPTYPQWPYNMFTMIHGQSPDECESVAAKIAEVTGLSNYELLYSTKEFKKTRMKYYISYNPLKYHQ